MRKPSPGAIRSFVILLYNAALQERGLFSLPVSVAAPFANRLFREVLPGRLAAVHHLPLLGV